MPSTRTTWRERVRRRTALLVLSALMLACAAAGAAGGELLVLTSTTPALRPGDVKETGSAIEVPRDAEVTLVASSGGVLRIEGPWRGRIEAPDDDTSLIAQLVALFHMPAPRRELGASRALGSCVVVDPSEDQHICLGAASCLAFESTGSSTERIVIEGPNLSPFEVQRPPLGSSWSWPKELPLRAGTYRIRSGADQRPAELRIHQQPELPSDAHRAAWMSEVGCTEQGRDVLSRLAQ